MESNDAYWASRSFQDVVDGPIPFALREPQPDKNDSVDTVTEIYQDFADIIAEDAWEKAPMTTVAQIYTRQEQRVDRCIAEQLPDVIGEWTARRKMLNCMLNAHNQHVSLLSEAFKAVKPEPGAVGAPGQPLPAASEPLSHSALLYLRGKLATLGRPDNAALEDSRYLRQRLAKCVTRSPNVEAVFNSVLASMRSEEASQETKELALDVALTFAAIDTGLDLPIRIARYVRGWVQKDPSLCPESGWILKDPTLAEAGRTLKHPSSEIGDAPRGSAAKTRTAPSVTQNNTSHNVTPPSKSKLALPRLTPQKTLRSTPGSPAFTLRSFSTPPRPEAEPFLSSPPTSPFLPSPAGSPSWRAADSAAAAVRPSVSHLSAGTPLTIEAPQSPLLPSSYKGVHAATRSGRVGSPWQHVALGRLKDRIAAIQQASQNEVWCCGQNAYGELGTGDAVERATFCIVNPATSLAVLSAACGNEHTILVSAFGEVYSVGYNECGQCGVAGRPRLGGITRFQLDDKRQVRNAWVFNGSEHSFVDAVDVATDSAELFAMGFNNRGQCGVGHRNAVLTPRPVMFPFSKARVSQVACSYYHSLFVLENGALLGCGRSDTGQLGVATKEDIVEPVVVVPFHDDEYQQVARRRSVIVLARSIDGATARPTAMEVFDFLDLEELPPETLPNTTEEAVAFKAASSEILEELADRISSRIAAFGLDVHAKLVEEVSDKRLRVVSVAAGQYHSLLILSDGRVFSCGRNEYGQTGLQPTACTRVFTRIMRGSLIESRPEWQARLCAANVDEVPLKPSETVPVPIVECCAGYYHSLLRTWDGRVISFGRNDTGMVGIGLTTPKVFMPRLVRFPLSTVSMETCVQKPATMIAAGCYHSIVVLGSGEDQQVFSFGRNQYGQLGLGDHRERQFPCAVNIEKLGHAVDGNSGPTGFVWNVKHVSAGFYHTQIVLGPARPQQPMGDVPSHMASLQNMMGTTEERSLFARLFAGITDFLLGGPMEHSQGFEQGAYLWRLSGCIPIPVQLLHNHAAQAINRTPIRRTLLASAGKVAPIAMHLKLSSTLSPDISHQTSPARTGKLHLRNISADVLPSLVNVSPATRSNLSGDSQYRIESVPNQACHSPLVSRNALPQLSTPPRMTGCDPGEVMEGFSLTSSTETLMLDCCMDLSVSKHNANFHSDSWLSGVNTLSRGLIDIFVECSFADSKYVLICLTSLIDICGQCAIDVEVPMEDLDTSRLAAIARSLGRGEHLSILCTTSGTLSFHCGLEGTREAFDLLAAYLSLPRNVVNCATFLYALTANEHMDVAFISLLCSRFCSVGVMLQLAQASESVAVWMEIISSLDRAALLSASDHFQNDFVCRELTKRIAGCDSIDCLEHAFTIILQALEWLERIQKKIPANIRFLGLDVARAALRLAGQQPRNVSLHEKFDSVVDALGSVMTRFSSLDAGCFLRRQLGELHSDLIGFIHVKQVQLPDFPQLAGLDTSWLRCPLLWLPGADSLASASRFDCSAYQAVVHSQTAARQCNTAQQGIDHWDEQLVGEMRRANVAARGCVSDATLMTLIEQTFVKVCIYHSAQPLPKPAIQAVATAALAFRRWLLTTRRACSSEGNMSFAFAGIRIVELLEWLHGLQRLHGIQMAPNGIIGATPTRKRSIRTYGLLVRAALRLSLARFRDPLQEARVEEVKSICRMVENLARAVAPQPDSATAQLVLADVLACRSAVNDYIYQVRLALNDIMRAARCIAVFQTVLSTSVHQAEWLQIMHLLRKWAMHVPLGSMDGHLSPFHQFCEMVHAGDVLQTFDKCVDSICTHMRLPCSFAAVGAIFSLFLAPHRSTAQKDFASRWAGSLGDIPVDDVVSLSLLLRSQTALNGGARSNTAQLPRIDSFPAFRDFLDAAQAGLADGVRRLHKFNPTSFLRGHAQPFMWPWRMALTFSVLVNEADDDSWRHIVTHTLTSTGGAQLDIAVLATPSRGHVQLVTCIRLPDGAQCFVLRAIAHAALKLGSWTHIGISFDIAERMNHYRASLRLYANGQLAASMESPPYMSEPTFIAHPFICSVAGFGALNAALGRFVVPPESTPFEWSLWTSCGSEDSTPATDHFSIDGAINGVILKPEPLLLQSVVAQASSHIESVTRSRMLGNGTLVKLCLLYRVSVELGAPQECDLQRVLLCLTQAADFQAFATACSLIEAYVKKGFAHLLTLFGTSIDFATLLRHFMSEKVCDTKMKLQRAKSVLRMMLLCDEQSRYDYCALLKEACGGLQPSVGVTILPGTTASPSILRRCWCSHAATISMETPYEQVEKLTVLLELLSADITGICIGSRLQVPISALSRFVPSVRAGSMPLSVEKASWGYTHMLSGDPTSSTDTVLVRALDVLEDRVIVTIDNPDDDTDEARVRQILRRSAPTRATSTSRFEPTSPNGANRYNRLLGVVSLEKVTPDSFPSLLPAFASAADGLMPTIIYIFDQIFPDMESAALPPTQDIREQFVPASCHLHLRMRIRRALVSCLCVESQQVHFRSWAEPIIARLLKISSLVHDLAFRVQLVDLDAAHLSLLRYMMFPAELVQAAAHEHGDTFVSTAEGIATLKSWNLSPNDVDSAFSDDDMLLRFVNQRSSENVPRPPSGMSEASSRSELVIPDAVDLRAVIDGIGLEELMAMGFEREWCLLALQLHANDAALAASWMIDNAEILDAVLNRADDGLAGIEEINYSPLTYTRPRVKREYAALASIPSPDCAEDCQQFVESFPQAAPTPFYNGVLASKIRCLVTREMALIQPTWFSGLDVCDEDYFPNDAILFVVGQSSGAARKHLVHGISDMALGLLAVPEDLDENDESLFTGNLLPGQTLLHQAPQSTAEGISRDICALRLRYPVSSFSQSMDAFRTLLAAVGQQPGGVSMQRLSEDIDQLEDTLVASKSATYVCLGPGPIMAPVTDHPRCNASPGDCKHRFMHDLLVHQLPAWQSCPHCRLESMDAGIEAVKLLTKHAASLTAWELLMAADITGSLSTLLRARAAIVLWLPAMDAGSRYVDDPDYSNQLLHRVFAAGMACFLDVHAFGFAGPTALFWHPILRSYEQWRTFARSRVYGCGVGRNLVRSGVETLVARFGVKRGASVLVTFQRTMMVCLELLKSACSREDQTLSSSSAPLEGSSSFDLCPWGRRSTWEMAGAFACAGVESAVWLAAVMYRNSLQDASWLSSDFASWICCELIAILLATPNVALRMVCAMLISWTLELTPKSANPLAKLEVETDLLLCYVRNAVRTLMKYEKECGRMYFSRQVLWLVEALCAVEHRISASDARSIESNQCTMQLVDLDCNTARLRFNTCETGGKVLHVQICVTSASAPSNDTRCSDRLLSSSLKHASVWSVHDSPNCWHNIIYGVVDAQCHDVTVVDLFPGCGYLVRARFGSSSSDIWPLKAGMQMPAAPPFGWDARSTGPGILVTPLDPTKPISRPAYLREPAEDAALAACATFLGSNSWSVVLGGVGFSVGRNKWSVRIDRSVSNYLFVGVASAAVNPCQFLGSDAFGWGYLADSALYHRHTKTASYGAKFGSGDIIGVELDCDTGTLSFDVNGVDQGVAFTNLSGKLYPAIAFYTQGQKVTILQDSSCLGYGVHVHGSPSQLLLDDIVAVSGLSNAICGAGCFNALDLYPCVHESLAWRQGTLSRHMTKCGYEINVNEDEADLAMIVDPQKLSVGATLSVRGSCHKVRGVHGGKLWTQGDGESGIWFLNEEDLHAYAISGSSDHCCTEVQESKWREVSVALAHLMEYLDERYVEEFCGWSLAADKLLVKIVNDICDRENCSPWSLTPLRLETEALPLILAGGLRGSRRVADRAERTKQVLLARFSFWRWWNDKMRSLLPLLDFTQLTGDPGPVELCHVPMDETLELDNSSLIPSLLKTSSQLRDCIFRYTVRSVLSSVLDRTATSPKRVPDDYDFPDDLPVIVVNRLRATYSMSQTPPKAPAKLLGEAVFGQMYRTLHTLSAQTLRMSYSHPMDDGQLRSFRVTFQGEGSDDYSGPYREVFAIACAELQAVPAQAGAVPATLLQILLPSSDAFSELGEERQIFVPNPVPPQSELSPWVDSTGQVNISLGSEAESVLQFFGQFLGIAWRSRVALDLCMSPHLWKALVYESLDIDDLQAVDANFMRLTENATSAAVEHARSLLFEHASPIEPSDLRSALERCNKEALESPVPGYEELRWTIMLASGNEVSILQGVPPEAAPAVSLRQLLDGSYVHAARRAKLHEYDTVLFAMRRGFLSVIPGAMLPLLRYQDLELGICGTPDVDISRLMEHTDYEEGISILDKHIQAFWRVLRSFSSAQRCAFLRFVWGRSRLPHSGALPQRLKIQNFHLDSERTDGQDAQLELLMAEGTGDELSDEPFVDQASRSPSSLRPAARFLLEMQQRHRQRSASRVAARPVTASDVYSSGEQLAALSPPRRGPQRPAHHVSAANGRPSHRLRPRTAVPSSTYRLLPPDDHQSAHEPLTNMDHLLPTAHVCFFALRLPRYSTEDIMRERLLYAIENCTVMDADYRVNQEDAGDMSWMV